MHIVPVRSGAIAHNLDLIPFFGMVHVGPVHLARKADGIMVSVTVVVVVPSAQMARQVWIIPARSVVPTHWVETIMSLSAIQASATPCWSVKVERRCHGGARESWTVTSVGLYMLGRMLPGCRPCAASKGNKIPKQSCCVHQLATLSLALLSSNSRSLSGGIFKALMLRMAAVLQPHGLF